jgi:NAD(P)-dependent dehydrogenase (short-subunit alcohol dehydrogenase family)
VNRLADKVCVITGAAGGIGEASAQRLAGEGARVVGVDLLEHSVGELSLQADLTDEAQVRAVYARVHEEFGRIDVLFNDAGLNGGCRDGAEGLLRLTSRCACAVARPRHQSCARGVRVNALCMPRRSATVAFLASDDAGFLTASAFPIDGGITAVYTTPT